MEIAFPGVHRSASAIIGFALLSAPLAFLTTAVIEHYAGVSILSPFTDWISSPTMNLVSPIVLLGSLTVALFLNLYALIQIHIHKTGKTFVGMIVFSPGISNMAVALVSASILAVLLGYAVVENIGHSSNDSRSIPNPTQEIEIHPSELPSATLCINC